MKRQSNKSKYQIKDVIRQFVGEYEWKNRNTIIVILGVIASYIVLISPDVHNLILSLGEIGYLGGFLVGMFYTYGLTTIPAAVSLFVLGENLNPLLLSAIAAGGAISSDYIIYLFVRDNLLNGIKDFSPAIKRTINLMINGVKKSKRLKSFMPIIAGLIIASPLPDELAAGLLGAIKFPFKKFLLYAYIFNFIGILMISSAAKIL